MSDERFLRTRIMLGAEACERLEQSSAMVVGLGAVGSYAVEALARSGVGRLRLVDFDVVSPTNINRQLLALDSTMGRPKTEVARERVLDISPRCVVEAVNCFVAEETLAEVLRDRVDIVVDAIDALNPKAQLLAAARTRGIAIISCLGAAMRSDPSRVRIDKLENVRACPLGRSVRSRLRRRGVPVDFDCVYSDEPLPYPLPVLPPDTGVDEQVLDRGRKRNVLGSLPTVTGIFGLTAANRAIEIISGRAPYPDYALESSSG